MKDALLQVKGLEKRFGAVQAVRGVSFDVRAGETFGIVGESGSGKSTTARLALQLIPASAGSVSFQGQLLGALKPAELRRLRRSMQMIFQDPNGSLNPRMTVRQLLVEPLEVHGLGDGASRAARAELLVDEVGLPRSALERWPHEFSGGQRQRIAIARALATEPALIVADEPVSALDVSVQAQVLNLMLDLRERHGNALLFISHDLRVIEFMCDRIAVMYLGEIVELGPKVEVCRRPLHPYTQALFDSMPGRGKAAKPLQGDIPSPAALPSGCAFSSRCPRVHDRCRSERPVLQRLADGHFAACHLLHPAAEET